MYAPAAFLITALALPVMATDTVFINPPAGSQYIVKQNSTFVVQWTSNWASTNLLVYAGPFQATTGWSGGSISNHMPPSVTSQNWTAGPVNNHDLKYAIHFTICNSEDCDNDRVVSPDIHVSATGTVVAPVNVPSSTTSSTSTSSATPSGNGNNDNKNKDNNNSSSNSNLGVGLGVGLGLGIPLVLGVAGLIYFFRRKKHQNIPVGGESHKPEDPYSPYQPFSGLKADLTSRSIELDTKNSAAEVAAGDVRPYPPEVPPEMRYELDGSGRGSGGRSYA